MQSPAKPSQITVCLTIIVHMNSSGPQPQAFRDLV